MTTLPLCHVYLECAHVLTDGRTDGRTDKNRQTIAVTPRLRFAARVNKVIEEVEAVPEGSEFYHEY